MSCALRIATTSLGSRKPIWPDFSVPLPPEWEPGGEGDGNLTLRDLIARVVRHEVDQFQRRQTDRQFVRMLTARQIAAAAEKGKIDSGGRETPLQDVDEEQAIITAWQAFEDGLFLVVIDEVSYHSLDQPVFLTADSRLTFIRLTMLSGG